MRRAGSFDRRTRPRRSTGTPRDYLTALIGTALSLTAGIVSYAAGIDPNASFVGTLVGTSIALELELLVRSSALRTDIASTSRVAGKILENPHFTESIMSVMESLSQVQNTEKRGLSPLAVTLLTERADQAIASCQEELVNLARGFFYSSGYDFTPLNKALLHCECILRSVAVQGADRLTYQEVGASASYTGTQVDLIKKGVRIERVFVYDEKTAAVTEMMDQQRALGVNVYEIAKRAVPAHLAVDCAIVDQQFCGRLQVGAGGSVARAHYSVNTSEIEAQIRLFEEIKHLAWEHK